MYPFVQVNKFELDWMNIFPHLSLSSPSCVNYKKEVVTSLIALITVVFYLNQFHFLFYVKSCCLKEIRSKKYRFRHSFISFDFLLENMELASLVDCITSMSLASPDKIKLQYKTLIMMMRWKYWLVVKIVVNFFPFFVLINGEPRP